MKRLDWTAKAYQPLSVIVSVIFISSLFIAFFVNFGAIGGYFTFEMQISASPDDGWSRSDGFFTATGVDISVGNISGIRDLFLRWDNIPIPNGAEILSANVTVQTTGTQFDGVGVETNIYFNDIDDALAPTTQSGHAALTRTTAFVAWDDEDFIADTETTSPDFSDVVQEVVDRSGWSSGNALMILWDDDVSVNVMMYRFHSWDGNSARAAELKIQWGTQYSRPDDDVTDGGWEDTTGGDNDGANFDEINETSPDDGSSYTRADSSATTMEVNLTDVDDPVTGVGHFMRFRAFASGTGGPERIRQFLYQGGTEIAQSSNFAITRSSWNYYNYTLSATEADSITDYDNLRFRFAPTASGSDTIDLTWAELEVPSAPSSCEDLTVSVNNPQGQMYFNGTTDTPTGGLWQEENVSEDFQTAVTPAMNVTNDDGSSACDVTLELLTSPGSGRTMKWSLTSTAPNPGVNSIPVGSNTTAVSSLGSGSTQAIYLWVDYDDSQGGSATPTLRVDTELP